MASAINSSGIGLVSRHKEQTWVPAERPGCSKPSSMAAHSTAHLSHAGWDRGSKSQEHAVISTSYYGTQQQSNLVPYATPKFSLCKRLMGSFQKNNLYGLKLSVRVCCRAILKDEVSATPVASSSEEHDQVDRYGIDVESTSEWAAFVPQSKGSIVAADHVDSVKVEVVKKKRKTRVSKKVSPKQEHVGRSLEAIGVRNAALSKCVALGVGMTEEEMLEWMSMLKRVGVAHSEIVSMVGKDASVLRAHIPDVELLRAHLKNNLGLERSAIASMFMQWPGLLLCSVRHVKEVTDYFVSVGLKPSDVSGVLLRRPHVLHYPLKRIQFSCNCLLEAGVLVDDLPPILKKVPELFSDLTQKNLDSKLEFLLKVGLGSGALGKAIARRPNILNYNLDNMRVAFKYLATLMVTRDVPKLVKRYAEVLVLDPQRKMAPMVNYLITLGVAKERIGKVILRRPQLLGYTILGLQPTVQYLIELGVKPELLGKVISTAPQVLTLNVEEKLKPVVEFFRSMGLNKERDIEMLLVRNAQILCCSIEKNLRPKFVYFKGLGLTEKSIANMIVLFPSMLGQSIEGSLAPKFNYLIHDMNRPVEEIVQFPQYFGYSLEKRIKPRHELLKDKAISTSLASMLACVDNDFTSRYLRGQPPSRAPYSRRVKVTNPSDLAPAE
ncbi:hypothetical protein M758_5G069600 [Ceratodon purpureus]|nr:hypothetical protein M758_5G069600 [Ceratodon purpureus]